MTSDDVDVDATARTIAQIDDTLGEVVNATSWVRGHRDELNRGPGARELSVAVTELESAENWLRRAISAIRHG